MDFQNYYKNLAEAFIIGNLRKTNVDAYDELIQLKYSLSEDRYYNYLFELANEYELKLHYFKKKSLLPRIQKVLGIIRNIKPENILDIGSGRGVFIWPLLNEFPNLELTCVDLLERRINLINTVKTGGYPNINAKMMDAADLSFSNNSFQITTALEVLEHIPDYKKALKELIRVTRNFLIITVPSKEDKNPEHLRVIKEDDIRNFLNDFEYKNVKFDFVLNHMLIVINLENGTNS